MKRKGTEYDVVDAGALATWLGAARGSGHATFTELAAESGIDKSILSRIANAKLTGLSRGTVERLERVADPERASIGALYDCLRAPEARWFMAAGAVSLDATLSRFASEPAADSRARYYRVLWHSDRPFRALDDGAPEWKTLSDARRAGAAGWYEMDGRRLESRLASIHSVAVDVNAFERAMVRRGHLRAGGVCLNLFAESAPDLWDDAQPSRSPSAARVALAWLRTVGPLLEARRYGGIERYWEELTEDELRRFVKAGLAREMLLLDRAPAMQRANRIAGDPTAFIAGMRLKPWDATGEFSVRPVKRGPPAEAKSSDRRSKRGAARRSGKRKD